MSVEVVDIFDDRTVGEFLYIYISEDTVRSSCSADANLPKYRFITGGPLFKFGCSFKGCIKVMTCQHCPH